MCLNCFTRDRRKCPFNFKSWMSDNRGLTVSPDESLSRFRVLSLRCQAIQ